MQYTTKNVTLPNISCDNVELSVLYKRQPVLLNFIQQIMGKASFELTIGGIRQLYKDLKSRREVMTWQEFADRIGYDRAYLSRVLNGHEVLTAEMVAKIKTTFVTPTKSVTHDEPGAMATPDSVPLHSSKDETIAILVRQISNSNDLIRKVGVIEETLKRIEDLMVREKEGEPERGFVRQYKSKGQAPEKER